MPVHDDPTATKVRVKPWHQYSVNIKSLISIAPLKKYTLYMKSNTNLACSAHISSASPEHLEATVFLLDKDECKHLSYSSIKQTCTVYILIH